jgi:hypothetical protein
MGLCGRRFGAHGAGIQIGAVDSAHLVLEPRFGAHPGLYSFNLMP